MDTTDNTTPKMLRRKDASVYLKEQFGIPCAVPTLNKLAVIGGGPAISYYGRTPLYAEADLRAWALAKIKPKVKSTSDRVQVAAS